MHIEFPLEFIVEGTPVSFQGKRPQAKIEWKDRVKTASSAVLPDAHFATQVRIAVTMYYFPDSPKVGDIDNIAKLVLDALSRHVYLDDEQVDRLVLQKFEPGNVFGFESPSAVLAEALDGQAPLLYVRLSDKPFEDLR